MGRTELFLVTVGVISDTHGLLRPEALETLRGVDCIVHAGDVGDPVILDALRELAPLTAIRGNMDRMPLARELPATAIVKCGGSKLFLVHNLEDLDFDPRIAGIDVVISGHTHLPMIEYRDGVLYLNPGSAGPQRFHLPIAVARLVLADGSPRAEVVHLLPTSPAS